MIHRRKLLTGAAALVAYSGLAHAAGLSSSVTPQVGGGIGLGFDGALGGAGNGPAPTLWTPANLGIANTVWYNASDASKFSPSTGAVASWTDSYSATVASQATSGNRPVRSATGFNSLPGVTFTAANSQSLVSTAAAPVPPLTVFVIGNFTIASTRPFISLNNVSAGLEVRGNTDGTYQALFQGARLMGASSAAPGATNAFAILTYDQTTWAWRVNGSASGSGSDTGTLVSGTMQIGTSPFSEFFDGPMGDIISVPAICTLSQIQKIEGYEAWQYGLQGNLPAGHPYKSRPPYVSDP